MTLGMMVGRRRYQQTLNGSFSAVSKPILQVNIFLKALEKKKDEEENKALDEIYKICILLHRSDVENS